MHQLEAGQRVALAAFVVLFAFRYLRTVVSMYTFLTFKPKPIREKPRYTSRDATVVVPTTFKEPGELVKCLKSIVLCVPATVYVVTSDANVNLVKHLVAVNSFPGVVVLGVKHLNKRLQMMEALKRIDTPITIFADDDVIWPSELYIDYVLACFEDHRVGAAGTRQRTRIRTGNCWNFLGVSYLERRVWNNISTNAIDSSISTLSGRTAAYRTDILTNTHFRRYFLNDHGTGVPPNTGDDKALTRYVYAHGWDIAIQSDSNAVLETTLEEERKLFIGQCRRWARSHWRGNLEVMQNETYWCSRKFWWGFYVIYVGQFQTPAVLFDGLHFLLLWLALRDSTLMNRAPFIMLAAWIFFTKIVKLIPHFCRRPQDVRFIPFSIAFSYLHGIINILSLIQLKNDGWESQNLQALEVARAQDSDVVQLLRKAQAEADGYDQPT